MAKLITELMLLPLEGQEFILSGLANDYVPVEIDGIVYVIPKEVDRLIKKLVTVMHEEEEVVSNTVK
jgi:hypothetical protein